ncbi:membrane dipeptidase [Vibrio sp. D404a]|uniref:dipeptidase n=1 Tax=unclassified Vibrio TaxID=2614977 RepID=UPI0025576882|nr:MULTISPECIES: membrane dipeptidase [unclassified Vibrio]MDK9735993.1 membrane dipeptidase [Vibrio sp. D404a]MDK9797841.1 membrane dipeptidase [Vibrio sp. D449a]
MRRLLIATAVASLSSAVNASIETKDWHEFASPEAQKYVSDNIVLDFYASPSGTGFTKDSEVAHYIDLAHERGITGASVTLGAPHTPNLLAFKSEHGKWTQASESAKTPIRFVKNVSDFQSAHDNGEYAIMWASQTTMPLDGDAANVAVMAKYGVKTMQLTYNETELTGSGVISMINGDTSGLTDFGKEVLDEMVKHGITVDLSHTSHYTTKGITDYMQKHHKGVPVIYSHSPIASTYGCQPHETLTETEQRMAKKNLKKGDPDFRLAACYRLLSDEQAKTVADMGGVVAVTATEWMMDGVWPEDITPKQFAEMIDGAVKVAGVDHVGIATDDMMTTAKVVPFTIANPDKYADNGYMVEAFNRGSTGCAELSKHIAGVVDSLWEMGYSNDDLAKLFGGNLMRVYAQTWK